MFMPQTEDKINDIKFSFYEELQRIFYKFPTYNMKIVLGNFSAIVGREDILKPKIGNTSYVKLVKIMELRFPHLKLPLSKVKYSHIATFLDVAGRLQMGKPTIRLTIF
jgi:hypothetical protein